MSYFEIYIIIPLLAITLDWLVSLLRLPRVAIFGTTAEVRVGKDTNPAVRKYVCAVQNDDDRLFEDPHRPVRVGVEIIGAGRFDDAKIVGCGVLAKAVKIESFVGPDQDVAIYWCDERHKRVEIDIPRLRPWKTLFFRLDVPASAYEVRMDVSVPSRSLFRPFLERLNEHTYQYSRLGYTSAKVAVKGSPEGAALLSGWKGWAQIAVPMVFATLVFYMAFWRVLLIPLKDRFLGSQEGSDIAAFFEPQSLVIDIGLVFLGVFLIVRMFRERGRPITSGYREARSLTPKSRPTEERARE